MLCCCAEAMFHASPLETPRPSPNLELQDEMEEFDKLLLQAEATSKVSCFKPLQLLAACGRQANGTQARMVN